MVAHAFIPVLGRKSHVNIYEFTAWLVYRANSGQPVWLYRETMFQNTKPKQPSKTKQKQKQRADKQKNKVGLSTSKDLI